MTDPSRLAPFTIATALSSSSVEELLALWRDMIERMPPPITAFRATHAVPYGRVYKQWNTRGELFVWVNRGELMDAVGKNVHTGTLANRRAVGSSVYYEVVPDSLVGIPVLFE